MSNNRIKTVAIAGVRTILALEFVSQLLT